MQSIGGAVEGQHGNRFGFGVDDPVLGNPCLGILFAFRVQVPPPVLFTVADHFHHKVGALRLIVRIGNAARPEQRDVWIAILAGPQANGQRREEHLTPTGCRDKGLQKAKQIAHDSLMKRVRHGKHLDFAVGEFDKSPASLLQRQVFALRPLPLQGEEQRDGPRRGSRLGGRRVRDRG